MFDLEKLAEFCQQHAISCRRDTPMREYTTFRVGGNAQFSALPSSFAELQTLVTYLHRQQIQPIWFVGRGSNLLVPDAGLPGVVIFTWGLSAVSADGDTLTADAGVSLTSLCRTAESNSLTGLEFAFGIPGTVGGGIYMNAGAYGGELRDCILWAEYLDAEGNLHRLDRDQLELSYRHSIFSSHDDWCIVRAGFRLRKGEPAAISDRMAELMNKRREKQPLNFPSAGSTFKRPEGAFAGALIEQCGLKGYRVGDACVSEKHAGFVVNLGSASCADIEALIAHVQTTVQRETGYFLETEVKKLG